MKRWIALLLLALSALSVPRLYQRATHGFRIEKCRVQWPAKTAWETQPLSLEREEQILGQTFSYLGRGRQSYVFESGDRQYVLKLFRFDASKMPYGRKIALALRQVCCGKYKQEFTLEERVVKTLSSCAHLFQRAPELGCLIAVHLNPCQTNVRRIKIKDRLGRSVYLRPEIDRYIIQEKGEIFFRKLRDSSLKGPLIDAYNQLLNELYQNGMINTDVKLGDNFGYREGKVFILDVGNLAYNPTLVEENKRRFKERLERWLERH